LVSVERDASDARDVARKTSQTGVRVIKISGASGFHAGVGGVPTTTEQTDFRESG
jgi:hypothetical protein